MISPISSCWVHTFQFHALCFCLPDIGAFTQSNRGETHFTIEQDIGDATSEDLSHWRPLAPFAMDSWIPYGNFKFFHTLTMLLCTCYCNIKHTFHFQLRLICIIYMNVYGIVLQLHQCVWGIKPGSIANHMYVWRQKCKLINQSLLVPLSLCRVLISIWNP